MVKLVNIVAVPEWALCYLVNGDREGLTEEEIKEVDEYYSYLLKAYKARSIIFDHSLIDEDKYGHYYYNNLNSWPAFGKKFGACATWQMPIYAIVDGGERIKYDLIIKGIDYDNKSRIIILKNRRFVDAEEAALWVLCYYSYMFNRLNMDVEAIESEDCVIEIIEEMR